MNLPLVLDVAVGLVFIYLILSLLASEIQELIATLLQWRSAHLKKSLEILLTGGEGTTEENKVRTIVNELYDNPLIKNINQEAKEGIAVFFRQLTWIIGDQYRKLRNNKPTFGRISNNTNIPESEALNKRRSAPSYIPAETFATTLLEKLNIPQLTHKLSTLNLQIFAENELKSKIAEYIGDENLKISEDTRLNLKDDFNNWSRAIINIVSNYRDNKATLVTTIKRIKEEVSKYITSCETYFSENEPGQKIRFINNLNSLNDDLFSDEDGLIRRLEPSLNQIIGVRSTIKQIYQESKQTIDNEDSEIYKTYKQIQQEMEDGIQNLPEPLTKSLFALATRAQIKAKGVEQELNQFKQEIEVWFDRSMDRATGVYKRNAKGVAFLIGFVLACLANADTFHIVNRLSTDSIVRAAITQKAGQIETTSCSNLPNKEQQNSQPTRTSPSDQLNCISTAVNNSLQNVSLPIGWSSANLEQQRNEDFYIQQGNHKLFFRGFKSFLGWIVSGLAIVMGAPFWFELLGKVINVRNTGPKPVYTKEQTPANNQAASTRSGREN